MSKEYLSTIRKNILGELMKLSFVLEQARSGELDAISKKDKTDEKIVAYLNLALIALYNRFQLATQEAIVTLRPDIPKTIYTMDSSDEDVKVEGGPMPDDDFMSIVGAFNENGTSITINDEKADDSVYTVAYNQLQIPLLAENAYVSVIYRKNPTLVTYVDDGFGNAADTDVALPIQLLEPALHYIGYRAHGAISGDIKAENNTHYTRYLRACDTAVEFGIVTADDTTGRTAIEQGFV